MSLMEQFSDPNTMHSLSFGDKMLASTITMLMGIGITFLVLCILWAFISIMGRVMKAASGNKTETAPAAAAAQENTDCFDLCWHLSDGRYKVWEKSFIWRTERGTVLFRG